jgi:hypothetical protein
MVEGVEAGEGLAVEIGEGGAGGGLLQRNRLLILKKFQ